MEEPRTAVAAWAFADAAKLTGLLMLLRSRTRRQSKGNAFGRPGVEEASVLPDELSTNTEPACQLRSGYVS